MWNYGDHRERPVHLFLLSSLCLCGESLLISCGSAAPRFPCRRGERFRSGPRPISSLRGERCGLAGHSAAEPLMELEQGGAPAALDHPFGDAEQRGGLALRQALIPEEVEDLPLRV